MVRIIESFVWTWKNDRKEFWEGIIGLFGCAFLIWVLFWVVPMFAYDM